MAFDWYGANQGGGLLGGVGGLIGGIFGDSAAEDDRRRAAATLRNMGALYSEINPYVSVGHEDAINLGPSAMEGIASQVDPSTRAAQMQALRSLMAVGEADGMDPQSRAALMQSQAQAAREQRAAQGALRQDFAARGRSGGGTELALRAAAGQQAANANSMAGVQAAADARTRALQSLMQGASLAGQVRGADYGQAADRAQALDRVAEYNARNQQAVRGRNIDRAADAQQRTFNNRMARAGGQAGAMQGQAEMSLANAQRRANQGYALGGAIGTGIGAVGGGFLGGW